MKTVRIKIYKFEELTEKAQQKAITSLCHINVDFEWWEYIYNDAETIGLKITGFDIGRGNSCDGKLLHSLTDVCELIMANHGESCETYKTAKAYLAEWAKLVREHSDGINTEIVSEGKEYDFDSAADNLEKEFSLSLRHDYLSILREEYEYQTTENSIKETIIANQYDFTADGNRYY